MQPNDQRGPSDHHPHPTEHGHEVTISINHVDVRLRPGSHTVTELKALGGVQPTDELSIAIDHQLMLLANDARVVIKGGECFVSNAPVGQSS